MHVSKLLAIHSRVLHGRLLLRLSAVTMKKISVYRSNSNKDKLYCGNGKNFFPYSPNVVPTVLKSH